MSLLDPLPKIIADEASRSTPAHQTLTHPARCVPSQYSRRIMRRAFDPSLLVLPGQGQMRLRRLGVLRRGAASTPWRLPARRSKDEEAP